MDDKTVNFLAYNIFDIRFEVETGGYATIWFNLDGPVFSTPEAMENMYIGFDEFLKYLKRRDPEMLSALDAESQRHETLLERLEASDFDWNGHIRNYIDLHIDLRTAETTRLLWLANRKARANDAEAQQSEGEWLRLAAAAEPSASPSWDDVAHAIIDSLNDTTVELYPEVLDFSPENNARLREIFESHGERLANQLYALTKSVREAEGKRETTKNGSSPESPG